MDKLIVIVGPTASGKSDLAVEIALRLRSGQATSAGSGQAQKPAGEIISADSRQVYRGMDIGTGKITKKEMRGIPHYLLDVVSPKTDFNVTKFKKLARKKIEEIISRNHLPIIAGGTGFWIDSLIYNWPIPEIKADKELRARLEKQTIEKLFNKLNKLDPERAKDVQAKNKRRLIRAIEIAIATKGNAPKFDLLAYYNKTKTQIFEINDKKLKIIIIGIKPSITELEQKIYKRLISRLNQDMIKEVKNLHSNGVSWKRLDDFGLEYRWISRYLRGKISKDEMVENLYRNIRKYARRQMTWFKRNRNIKWFNKPPKAEDYLKRLLNI